MASNNVTSVIETCVRPFVIFCRLSRAASAAGLVTLRAALLSGQIEPALRQIFSANQSSWWVGAQVIWLVGLAARCGFRCFSELVIPLLDSETRNRCLYVLAFIAVESDDNAAAIRYLTSIDNDGDNAGGKDGGCSCHLCCCAAVEQVTPFPQLKKKDHQLYGLVGLLWARLSRRRQALATFRRGLDLQTRTLSVDRLGRPSVRQAQVMANYFFFFDDFSSSIRELIKEMDATLNEYGGVGGGGGGDGGGGGVDIAETLAQLGRLEEALEITLHFSSTSTSTSSSSTASNTAPNGSSQAAPAGSLHAPTPPADPSSSPSTVNADGAPAKINPSKLVALVSAASSSTTTLDESSAKFYFQLLDEAFDNVVLDQQQQQQPSLPSPDTLKNLIEVGRGAAMVGHHELVDRVCERLRRPRLFMRSICDVAFALASSTGAAAAAASDAQQTTPVRQMNSLFGSVLDHIVGEDSCSPSLLLEVVRIAETQLAVGSSAQRAADLLEATVAQDPELTCPVDQLAGQQPDALSLKLCGDYACLLFRLGDHRRGVWWTNQYLQLGRFGAQCVRDSVTLLLHYRAHWPRALDIATQCQDEHVKHACLIQYARTIIQCDGDAAVSALLTDAAALTDPDARAVLLAASVEALAELGSPRQALDFFGDQPRYFGIPFDPCGAVLPATSAVDFISSGGHLRPPLANKDVTPTGQTSKQVFPHHIAIAYSIGITIDDVEIIDCKNN